MEKYDKKRQAALDASPEEFFSKIWLYETGIERKLASRIYHAAINSSHWDHVTNRGRETPIKTMREYLSVHKDSRDLLGIKNIGKLSVEYMVKLIRQRGLTIGDSARVLDD